jgi:hypothetical protein
MSIVRVGSTQKFSENWDNIFGGKKSISAAKKSAGKKKKPSAKAAKRGKK